VVKFCICIIKTVLNLVITELIPFIKLYLFSSEEHSEEHYVYLCYEFIITWILDQPYNDILSLLKLHTEEIFAISQYLRYINKYYM